MLGACVLEAGRQGLMVRSQEVPALVGPFGSFHHNAHRRGKEGGHAAQQPNSFCWHACSDPHHQRGLYLGSIPPVPACVPASLPAALRDMHGSDGPSASRGWSERIMTRSKVGARRRACPHSSCSLSAAVWAHLRLC